MAHVISRIFANQTDADAAYQDLSDYGFQPHEIFTVDPRPAADGRDETLHEIADQIAKCFIPKHHAAAYAEHVARGGVFVSVHAPFTAGRKAAAALDRNNPVDTQTDVALRPSPSRYDEATPLSSALFLPVRLDDPAPLSTLAGLPALVSSPPRLLSEPAPLSSSMGWPVSSADPTPASTATARRRSRRRARCSRICSASARCGTRRRPCRGRCSCRSCRAAASPCRSACRCCGAEAVRRSPRERACAAGPVA